jgi:hypothetical protein
MLALEGDTGIVGRDAEGMSPVAELTLVIPDVEGAACITAELVCVPLAETETLPAWEGLASSGAFGTLPPAFLPFLTFLVLRFLPPYPL